MMKNSHDFDYGALVTGDRVNSAVYTTPEIFAAEMERIFHRGWVFIGHASEVPNPGDFRLKHLGLQPVIMVRDQAGQVRLLLNRCRHRGAAVCTEERGNLRSFRCAYHGWTYKLDGALAGVPYPEAYGDDFRREDYGLTKVPRMGDYRGFIFGSLNAAGVTLEEHLGRTREQIDLFVEMSPAGEIDLSPGAQKYRFTGNWKLQVENGMDGYHPPVTHESIVMAVERQRGRKFDTYTADSPAVTRDLGGGHAMLDFRKCPANRSLNRETYSSAPADETFRETYADAMRRSYGEARAAEILQAGGTHMLIFPNLIILGVQLRVISPIAVDNTEVAVYPALLRGVPDEINQIRLRGHEAFFGPASAGSPDDTEMFERMGAGFAATLEPWAYIGRGMNSEREDADGSMAGHVMDEITQRAIWRQWKKLMTGAAVPGKPRRSPVRRAAAKQESLSAK